MVTLTHLLPGLEAVAAAASLHRWSLQQTAAAAAHRAIAGTLLLGLLPSNADGIGFAIKSVYSKSEKTAATATAKAAMIQSSRS
jgi:hypothetical protein